MQPIRVLLANPHPIVRSELRSLLERDPLIRVVGEAANGREAIVLAEYQRPAVAILEMNFDRIRGIDVARAILSGSSVTRIVFVSAVGDEGYVDEAFHAGARGYVLGNSADTDLCRAVAVVAAGGAFLSSSIGRSLVDNWSLGRKAQESTLTEREKLIFLLLAEGRTETDIAHLLEMSESQARLECKAVESSLQSLQISKLLISAPQNGL